MPSYGLLAHGLVFMAGPDAHEQHLEPGPWGGPPSSDQKGARDRCGLLGWYILGFGRWETFGLGCGSCGKRAAFSKPLWASGPFRSSATAAASIAPFPARGFTCVACRRRRRTRMPQDRRKATRTTLRSSPCAALTGRSW